MRWFAQILLRFQAIDFSHEIFRTILGDRYKEDEPPPCYDVTKLTMLKLNQVVWYDECHRKCAIGASGSRIGNGRPNVSVCFKRNKDGKLDASGNYSDEIKKIVKVKYEAEARLCFGVYIDMDGNGQRVEPFDYTGSRLVTRTERDKLRLQQIGWIKNQRCKYHFLSFRLLPILSFLT